MIRIGAPEKEPDLLGPEVNIEGDRHRSIPGIQNRIRVPEHQGPSIKLSQIGQGHPHRDVLGVASYILGSATLTQVLVLSVVRLTT